jgi:hypothetical protein
MNKEYLDYRLKCGFLRAWMYEVGSNGTENDKGLLFCTNNTRPILKKNTSRVYATQFLTSKYIQSKVEI